MSKSEIINYMKARDEYWEEYKKDNPDMSEYMERDYKDGFHDGWNAALHDRDRELRERAAIAAMDAILRSDVKIKMDGNVLDYTPVNVAKVSVILATALINQLNKQ